MGPIANSNTTVLGQISVNPLGETPLVPGKNGVVAPLVETTESVQGLCHFLNQQKQDEVLRQPRQWYIDKISTQITASQKSKGADGEMVQDGRLVSVSSNNFVKVSHSSPKTLARIEQNVWQAEGWRTQTSFTLPLYDAVHASEQVLPGSHVVLLAFALSAEMYAQTPSLHDKGLKVTSRIPDNTPYGRLETIYIKPEGRQGLASIMALMRIGPKEILIEGGRFFTVTSNFQDDTVSVQLNKKLDQDNYSKLFAALKKRAIELVDDPDSLRKAEDITFFGKLRNDDFLEFEISLFDLMSKAEQDEVIAHLKHVEDETFFLRDTVIKRLSQVELTSDQVHQILDHLLAMNSIFNIARAVAVLVKNPAFEKQHMNRVMAEVKRYKEYYSSREDSYGRNEIYVFIRFFDSLVASLGGHAALSSEDYNWILDHAQEYHKEFESDYSRILPRLLASPNLASQHLRKLFADAQWENYGETFYNWMMFEKLAPYLDEELNDLTSEWLVLFDHLEKDDDKRKLLNCLSQVKFFTKEQREEVKHKLKNFPFSTEHLLGEVDAIVGFLHREDITPAESEEFFENLFAREKAAKYGQTRFYESIVTLPHLSQEAIEKILTHIENKGRQFAGSSAIIKLGTRTDLTPEQIDRLIVVAGKLEDYFSYRGELLRNLIRYQDLSATQIENVVKAALGITDASYLAYPITWLLTHPRLSSEQKEQLLAVMKEKGGPVSYYYLLENKDLPEELVSQFFHRIQEKELTDKASTAPNVVPWTLFDYRDHENLQLLRTKLYGQYQSFKESLQKEIIQ